MSNIKHVTGCKTCGNIIFDGTPGEIYEAEKHEAGCPKFEYIEWLMCVQCDAMWDPEHICDCEEPPDETE